MGKKGMRREVIGVERKKRQGDNRGKHDGKGNGVGGKKGELIASTKYYSYQTATESCSVPVVATLWRLKFG